MPASVVKIETGPNTIQIRYSDGSREEIEFGVYERKNAANRTVEERLATADDFARLNAIVDSAGVAATQEFVAADGTVVEVGPGKIELSFPDGTKEEIEDGVYERKDASGVTIEERAATAEDFARLDAFASAAGAPGGGAGGASGGATLGDDDGAPDQGSGDAIVGDDRNERLRGSGQDDRISGEGGDDRIRGRGGDDSIEGGAGDDRIAGGGGKDVISGGAGDDRLAGGRGRDVLAGGEDDDVLRGGGGGDRLDGGEGRDRYEGGAGADVFVFGVDGVRDAVKDFRSGVDHLDVSAFELDTGELAEILASARARGGDLYLAFGGGDVLKLHDVGPDGVEAADFIL